MSAFGNNEKDLAKYYNKLTYYDETKILKDDNGSWVMNVNYVKRYFCPKCMTYQERIGERYFLGVPPFSKDMEYFCLKCNSEIICEVVKL